MRSHLVLASLGLLLAWASPADADDGPGVRPPPVRPALAVEVEPARALATLGPGEAFSLRLRVVNGTVYGLPRLTVTVKAVGARLTSRRTWVFRDVDANGGAVELVIRGALRAARGSVDVRVRSAVVDPDLAPFTASRRIELGPATAGP